jgi:predicted dinucleotide-binding enzyme
LSGGWKRTIHFEICFNSRIKFMGMKKIGIIGSGLVARALAKGLISHGYRVMAGSRDSVKRVELQKETGALSGTFEETASFGEIVIFAVKGTVAEKVMSDLADRLSGKTVIDTTNPIAEKPPVNGVIQFFTSLEESLMEKLQRLAPEAHLVKAFNSVGNAFMIDPAFEIRPTMFICGNDSSAKKDVTSLLEEVGWEVEDMGNAEAARAIEPLCMLWCIPGMRENKWNHAFKLLKKNS